MTLMMGKERQYQPSWIDRYNRWVDDRPLDARIHYALFGFVLIAIQLLFLWLAGGYLEVELLPIILFNGLFTPFLLALIHFLDKQSLASLKTMRISLDISDLEFEKFKYLLANMPARPPLVAGLTVLALVILMEQLWVTPARYAALVQMPVFTVVFQLVDKSSAFLFGVFIYHTIRQLSLVNTISTKHLRINLFHLAPSRAFSRLTAATSIGLVVGVYGWMLINPELFTDPIIFGIAAAITILAVIVFVWPLYGVHRRMESAKEQTLQEINLRFEAAIGEFNRCFQEQDYAAIDQLNGTISSLDIQYRKIKDIPTWPWMPETAQIVVSAVGGPLLLAILRFFIDGLLVW